MSLYAEYVKELYNREIVETDEGFATYSCEADGLYIQDIYVRPDFRHKSAAATMADKIADIAKAKQLKRLYGSVCPSANGSTASLKILLAYGFELHTAQSNFIILKKELSL